MVLRFTGLLYSFVSGLLANLVAVLTASMTFERPRLTKANGDDFLTARCTIILSHHMSAPWDSLCTANIQPPRFAGHVNMNTNCPPGRAGGVNPPHLV